GTKLHVGAAAAGHEGVEKLASPGAVLAKSSPPDERVWREDEAIELGKSLGDSGAGPKFYRTLSLNEIAQREVLSHAPMEFTKAARQTQVVLTLPMPDGRFTTFRVEESPVMAPRLAALFPTIKTYRGQGLDDPTATTRFDVTPAGFHAIVLSTQGTVIIEPAATGHAGQYVSYDQRDAPKNADSFHCLVSDTK